MDIITLTMSILNDEIIVKLLAYNVVSPAWELAHCGLRLGIVCHWTQVVYLCGGGGG